MFVLGKIVDTAFHCDPAVFHHITPVNYLQALPYILLRQKDHHCFTIAEVLAYEALGLAEPGRGAHAVEEGWVEVGGKLPVNASGGLKAKGHPVGATGVSMAVLAVRQLLGKAIGHQVEGAEVGLTYNIGGSAVSNYALIFKRVK